MMDSEILTIREQLEALTNQVEKANAKSNHTLLKTIFNILGSTAVIIFSVTVIYYAGKVSRDVEILKDCAIPRAEWEDVKGKANATYKHVFKIPDAAYQARGQQLP